MNKLRIAVSFIIYNASGEFLVVKRPPSDVELPNAWGLPATSVNIKKEPWIMQYYAEQRKN